MGQSNVKLQRMGQQSTEKLDGAVNYRPVEVGAENTSMEPCTWNRKQRSGDRGAAKYETATDVAA